MYPPPIYHRCIEYHYTKEVAHITACTYTKAPSSNWPYISGIPLYHISSTYSRMHIYKGPPPPIDHRCMEYHYTTEVSHIAECTSLHGTCTPPPFDYRSMEYHYTKWVWHRGIWWPRGVLHKVILTFWHFQMVCTHQMSWTPLLQLIIDVWNTTTPNMFHI